jgi:hypothetical protein
VNNKGLVTSASNVTYATGGGTATGANTGDNATNSQYSGLVSNATHTGDVTGSTALTLVTNIVTNAKLAQVPTKTFKGRTSAATGNVEDLTVAQVKTDLTINLVDNTSDLNKPISTATQTTLDGKQNNLGFTPYNATNPSGFTANSTDAQLRDRTTHTGTQLSSTISDIQSTITNNTAVLSNTAKVSYSDAAKVSNITVTQAVNLDTMESNITTNNAKVGITTTQSSNIVTNNAKISFDNTSSTRLANTSGTNTGDNATNTQYSGLVSNATHTGDATGSTALTLATVNANIGTFNNVAVNGKGLVTSASNVTYATGGGTATGANTGDQDLSGKANIASPTFTGTVSGITKSMVGLSNVDNTSDVNKPVSTATQSALNSKANLASPSFTGTVTAPTFVGALNGIANSSSSLLLSSYGSSSITNGNGDGSDFALTNIDINSWNGIGIKGMAGNVFGDGTRTIVFNARTGSILAKGTVTASPATASTHLATLGQITKAQVGLSNVPNLSFSGTNTGDQNLANYVALNGFQIITGNKTMTGANAFNGTLGATTPSSVVATTGVFKVTNANNKVLIVEDNARRVNIGRDEISVTDLAGTGSLMQLQNSGNINIASGGGTTAIGGVATISPTGLAVTENIEVIGNGKFTGSVTSSSQFLAFGGVRRFITALEGSESGSNSGSSFSLFRYADSGDFLGRALLIKRANGFLGLNSPDPQEQLDVVGNGKFSGKVTATSFFQSSDIRLKNIIKRDGDVIYYTWKDKRDTKIHIGYIAQKVRATNPDQVNKDDKGYLSVNYIEILVEKIRNLEKEIELLKAK